MGFYKTTSVEIMHDISIIIPAFNEAKSIGNVLQELLEIGIKDNIIVIDDGSTDETFEIVKTTGVRVYRNEYNMGYGAAIKIGIRKTNTEYIALLDADGQHKTRDLMELIKHIGECDMVVGERTNRFRNSFIRGPAMKMLQFVANNLSGRKIPDLNSGMRVMKRKDVVNIINILPNTFSLTTTLTIAFHKMGYLVKYVPIRVNKRTGKSTVNIPLDGFRTLLLIIRIINLFSPLRFFLSFAFFLFLLFSISLSLNMINGFNITDGTILFGISSLLIFAFGILADQVSHIRREMGARNNDKPNIER